MEHKEYFSSTISRVSYTMSCFQYKFFPFVWMIWLTYCLHFGLRSMLFWGKLTIAIKIMIIISHNKWPWGLWLQGYLLDHSINDPGSLSFLLWHAGFAWLRRAGRALASSLHTAASPAGKKGKGKHGFSLSDRFSVSSVKNTWLFWYYILITLTNYGVFWFIVNSPLDVGCPKLVCVCVCVIKACLCLTTYPGCDVRGKSHGSFIYSMLGVMGWKTVMCFPPNTAFISKTQEQDKTSTYPYIFALIHSP